MPKHAALRRDLGTLTPLGFAELFLIVVLIASSVLTAYALAAAYARRLFTSPGTVRLVNRGSGAITAGTAVTSATR